MITAEKEKLTYADYAQLEEGAPYQLIDGELVMSPSPTLHHQDIVIEFATQLRSHVLRHDLGKVYISPADVYLTEHDTYQPDVLFVATERLEICKTNRVEGAPDLVMEVLSPATAYYDLIPKKQSYEKHGVREYWIVDPMENTVEVLAHRDGRFESDQKLREKGTARSSVVPEFSIELKQLFAK